MDLVDSFLAGYKGNTARAYGNDIATWEAFLAAQSVELLDANRAHVDSYARALEGEGRSAATVARRLAAISGLYTYAVSEELLERNPVTHVRRPHVSQDSQTLGLSLAEARALQAAAKAESARSYALVTLMLVTGCRLGEALALTTEDIYTDGGYRVVRLVGKRGKVRVMPVNGAQAALDAHLQGRTGFLFVNRDGGAWAQSQAFRTVQRLAAAAGIADADRITPHSLRHTSLTVALSSGAPVHEVQDFAGHSDPRTTQRYNRARLNLERSPAHLLATAFA